MDKKGITPGILNVIIVGIIAVAILIATFVSTEIRLVVIGIAIILLGISLAGKLKEDRSKITVFLIAITVGIGLILLTTSGILQQVFTPEGTFTEDEVTFKDGREILNFCDERQECIDYLVEQKGMPEGYLEESKYDIKCENGVCETIVK